MDFLQTPAKNTSDEVNELDIIEPLRGHSPPEVEPLRGHSPPEVEPPIVELKVPTLSIEAINALKVPQDDLPQFHYLNPIIDQPFEPPRLVQYTPEHIPGLPKPPDLIQADVPLSHIVNMQNIPYARSTFNVSSPRKF